MITQILEQSKRSVPLWSNLSVTWDWQLSRVTVALAHCNAAFETVGIFRPPTRKSTLERHSKSDSLLVNSAQIHLPQMIILNPWSVLLASWLTSTAMVLVKIVVLTLSNKLKVSHYTPSPNLELTLPTLWCMLWDSAAKYGTARNNGV